MVPNTQSWQAMSEEISGRREAGGPLGPTTTGNLSTSLKNDACEVVKIAPEAVGKSE